MVASEQHLFQTIVQFDKTIVLPRKLETGSIHDCLFCYCPLVSILFEVLRISSIIYLTLFHLIGLFHVQGLKVKSHSYWSIFLPTCMPKREGVTANVRFLLINNDILRLYASSII